ncbi:hypothetical protein [Campylobacter avium]|nr:hypothetical protein [Campylobacter avium]
MLRNSFVSLHHTIHHNMASCTDIAPLRWSGYSAIGDTKLESIIP